MFEYQNLKGYMYFYFLNVLTHGSLLVKYIKVHKKNLINKKEFWNKKTTCPHVFFECFKHIKGFLKHSEFSWKLCSCNFENIKTYFKILTIFSIYSVPMVIFQNFEKQFLRIVHTRCGSLFHAFTHMVLKFTFFSISKFIPP